MIFFVFLSEMLNNTNSSTICLKIDFLFGKSLHFFDFIESTAILTVVLVIVVFDRALMNLMNNNNTNILKRVSIVIVSNFNVEWRYRMIKSITSLLSSHFRVWHLFERFVIILVMISCIIRSLFSKQKSLILISGFETSSAFSLSKMNDESCGKFSRLESSV